MSFPRLLPIMLAVACLAAGALGAAAQARTQLAKVPARAPDKSIMHPIIFYLAHGEANACGPGCSEWIIADGRIDAGAAFRLQQLLWQLSGAHPPLFLNSPGGLINPAIAVGRLIRAHNLTVSIGHTIPLNCGAAPAHLKTCGALMGAGERLEARLDPLSAMCNSACVYVLAGGSVRLIPPWVALGIHDVGFEQTTGFFRPTQLAMAIGKELADERLHAYMRDMGIDTRLLTEAFAIPFTSVARLSRTDAARFGLDRREFGETVWQFFDKPVPAIRKFFFVRTDDSQARYINGMAAVFCGRNESNRILSFGREHLKADTADITGQPPVNVSMNGQDFSLLRAPNTRLYARQGLLPATAIEGIADKASLIVPAAELGRQQGSSGDVKLSMFGFAQARAKLQKACAQVAYVAMTRPQTMGASALVPHSVLQTMQSASALPMPSEPLVPGATRAQVDAVLGAPTKSIGTVSLYSYTSSDNARKVMAGYFKSGRLQHFARYVLRDGKVVDELNDTELSDGKELAAIHSLLVNPDNAATGAAALPAKPDSQQ